MPTGVRSAPDRRTTRVDPAVALGAAGLAVATIASWTNPGAIAHGPVLCPFRRLTGLPCPGCGLTRSVVATLHGHLAQAVHAHPFGPLVLLFGVALLVGRLAPVRARLRVPASAQVAAVVLITPTWLVWAVARALRA